MRAQSTGSPDVGKQTAKRFSKEAWGLREAKGDLLVLAESDGIFMARDLFKLVAYAEDFDLVCETRTTSELIWQKANMGWLLRFTEQPTFWATADKDRPCWSSSMARRRRRSSCSWLPGGLMPPEDTTRLR